jgi:hypothetical protein
MGIKDELLSRLPQLAMMALAGKQGGMPAMSALMGGQFQAQQLAQRDAQQQQQLQRQATMDEQSAARQHAELANMETDNARLDAQSQLDRFHRALQLVQAASQQQGQIATDPAAADAAIAQQIQAAGQTYGVDASQLTPFAPPMAPIISARKKQQAQALYERAEKRYNPKGDNPQWESAITLQTGEQFGDVTPAKLREMFEAPAVDASGAPALPPKAQRALQLVDLGGKKVAIDATQLEHGDTFTETPAASAGGGSDSEPLTAIMGPDGAPVLVPRSQAVGKRPASTREQGRPVQSGDANRIAELKTSLNDLATLKAELGTTGAASKIGAMLPNAVTEFTGWGSDAKQRQATIDRVKQVIGKALEGGVLRREDEYKYVKILPTIGDPPEVAASKIEGLARAIQQRLDTTVEALEGANFDVSKFGQSAPSAASDADPLGLFK